MKANEKNADVRKLQIQQILDIVSPDFEKHNVLLLGDFNGEPFEEGLQLLEGAGFKKSIQSDETLTTFKIRDKAYKRQIDYIWLRSKGKQLKDSTLKIREKNQFVSNFDFFWKF